MPWPLEEEVEKLGFAGRQRDGARRPVEHAGRLVEINAGQLPMARLPEAQALAEPVQLPLGDPVVDVEASPAVVADLLMEPAEELFVECRSCP